MANTKSNVNVKIDADVKALATQLLARMGLDQTTAIDIAPPTKHCAS
jgi:addiction module RelB/DinJ family antitoxin